MYRLQVNEQTWAVAGIGACLSLAVLLFLSGLQPQTQHRLMPERHCHYIGMQMFHDEAMTSAHLSKLLADKKESEFNHHLAGLLVLVAGAFILFQRSLMERWPMVQYVWPGCFLLSGMFVLIWSDTELWPFGHRQWPEALQNNPEVLQHKTFALLLLALGIIEWRRVGGIVMAAWDSWVFPVVAICGSLLLLFHHHEAGMQGPDHMAVMSRIQLQHLGYAVVGIAAGLARGFVVTRTNSHERFKYLWPVLIIVLGVMLMGYRE